MKKVLVLFSLLLVFGLSFGQDSTVVSVDSVAVTDQIANVIDSIAVPIAELVADELRDAPGKGAGLPAWIMWAIGFASAIIVYFAAKVRKPKK